MAEGIDDLTEKEKEALRLLLAGHDAKSSARELDISHHTVNDRLRSARRKMEVSTSREAARILGEAEGSIPKPLVHEPLGSAPQGSQSQGPSSADESPGKGSPGWRAKGSILMSIVVAAALGVAFLPGLFSAAFDHPVTTTTAEPASPKIGLEARIENAQSVDEARRFLELLDEGDAEASYAATGGKLRQNQNYDMWELGVELRNNGADFSTRKIVGAGGRDDKPKPGEWAREVFIFQSNDGEVRLTEYLVTQRFGEEWKIIEYDLRGLDDDED